MLKPSDNLIKQSESHIVVGSRFFRFCFLLFFLLLSSSRGSSITSRSRSTTTTCGRCRSNIANQISDVASLESFGEETRPESLDVDFSCLDDFGHFLSGDVDVVVIEDECTVYTSEF